METTAAPADTVEEAVQPTETANPAITRDTMAAQLEHQRQGFIAEGKVSLETRVDRLQRLYDMIRENQADIVAACNADFGNRSRHQSQMSEVMAVMGAAEHAIENVADWMGSSRRKVMFPLNLFGARARVDYQPKGVVGVLGTWNFPVYTSVSPLAGIFAAGNRAMVKFSELTPSTSALMQDLLSRYYDAAECVGVSGGPEVGAQFAGLPFDHIIFTGGTGIGRHILRAAADNLTPVTLELGGKSPVIVGRSYDLGKAARRIMTGKALNMGQACLAPDYCFVPEEQLDAFIEEVTNYFSGLFPTILANPDYTSVINGRHHQRLTGMLQDAADKGADLREINPAAEDFSQQGPGLHKIPMTLVVNPGDDMRVMQEELFGPILCVKSYRQVDDCIGYINSRPRPLGLYYFGEDAAEEQRVLDATISGGVTVNDVMTHSSCEDLPFGGIGHSGMGNYHGHDGFLTFSHPRAVFRQTRLELMKLSGMLPPYGDKTQKQLDKLTKYKR